MRGYGKTIEVTVIPPCDMCKAMKLGNATPSAVDGRTVFGTWANMCQYCFDTYGIGLGTGLGQLLSLKVPTVLGTQSEGGETNVMGD